MLGKWSVHTTHEQPKTEEHGLTPGEETPCVMFNKYLSEPPSVAKRLLSGARGSFTRASKVVHRRVTNAALSAPQSRDLCVYILYPSTTSISSKFSPSHANFFTLPSPLRYATPSFRVTHSTK